MNPAIKITIISAVYPPEPQVSARMSYDLAEHLAQLGHCITVLCPQPSRPLGADYSLYVNHQNPVETHEDGINVVRLPSFAAPGYSMLPRFLESVSFGREAARYLTALHETPDVVYVNAWPLFSQALIARYAKKNGVPVVLQIMDIYPESFTNKLPAFLRPLFHVPLEKLDKWIAINAVSVVVISENMRRIYSEKRKVNAERIVTISTWQNDDLFDNIPTAAECRQRYRVPIDLFTFLFLGNIGPVAGVDLLINAFAQADMLNTQLLIVGDGAAKPECIALVNNLKLANVHFISDPKAANVPVLQGMADVCLLPMKFGAGMSSIPSKLPSYMLSAKPVIATVDHDSDTANFIRRAECGWVGDAEDLNWLVARMVELRQMSMPQLESIGVRGRAFALKHFSKSSGVVRLARIITQSCCK